MSALLTEAAGRKHRVCMQQLLQCPAVIRAMLHRREDRQALLPMMTQLPSDMRGCMASQAWVRRRGAVLARLSAV